MMVRYKRFRKRSSRVIKMKFQSFFDISTQDGEMQIISVNAGGSSVLERLSPFFQAYKYYKLGGVSFKLIPASTLPVDPSGFSFSEGEPGVDPRDQLTPGMCRITNGEDVFEDITGMVASEQHKLYNNMLLDPRWYKWMLQSGVKRFGKPRYWQIGQLHQDKWPGATVNMPVFASDGNAVLRTDAEHLAGVAGSGNARVNTIGSSNYGIFQTGHKGVLGWLPTDGIQHIYKTSGDGVKEAFLSAVPEIELFKILMPPAYKTRYWYRAFLTETVYFKDPIVMNINEYRPIDVFHTSSVGSPLSPGSVSGDPYRGGNYDRFTGGNDGSD